MKLVLAFFAISAVALAQDWAPSKAAGRLDQTTVPLFAAHAGTQEALRQLSREVLFRGVFGVESLGGLEPPLSISAQAATVGWLVQEICRQDARYKAVTDGNPRVINLLAADSKAPGQSILNFKLSRLDIVTHDLAQNVIARLPDFSLELRGHLANQYVTRGGKEMASSSSAGSGMVADGKLRWFELHLADVTVREALNAIALQSLDLALATGTDPRLISTPVEKQIFPTGWLFRDQAPLNMPFDVWMRLLFSPL